MSSGRRRTSGPYGRRAGGEATRHSAALGLLKKPDWLCLWAGWLIHSEGWVSEAVMLGRKDRDQPELFVTGSLRLLLPDDHVLVRVDRVLDLSWLRDMVADLYCPDNGRPGIDPEVAVRLMLAGLLLGIVHDRRLLREAQVNLAIRWFVGYGLHERLNDHSSLTRIRQRWGAERFKTILTRSVEACVAAGIARGEVVHVDASLIRADVTWDAIADAHAEAVVKAHPALPGAAPVGSAPTADTPPPGRKLRRVCTTDPDASLGKVRRNLPAQPCYKQHTAVDQERGVVLDIMVTTGAAHESTTVEGQLDTVAATTGRPIGIATLDAGYAVTRISAALEARGIEAVVPTRPERPPKRGVIPVRRFKLDARHNRVRCPRGRILRPHGKPDTDGFQAYRATVKDCSACPLRARCFSPTMKRRAILLHKDHPALIRARRKHLAWEAREKAIYASHRGRVEGVHGEAKTWHGLARAVRRGIGNMQRILARTRDWRTGDPLDPRNQLGALIDAEHCRKVVGYLEGANSATALAGAKVDGPFVAPTIFDGVKPGDRLAREEIFGQVLSVVTVGSTDEAIAVANDTDYGLVASVFTSNAKAAIRTARAIRAGTVTVNCYGEGDITTPFGGYKQSGFGGRDKSLHAHDQYTELKTIWMDLSDTASEEEVG